MPVYDKLSHGRLPAHDASVSRNPVSLNGPVHCRLRHAGKAASNLLLRMFYGLLALVPGLATAVVETAMLDGVVSTTGGPAAGVTVTAENVDNGQVRETTAGEDGAYRLVGLKPGTYVVRPGSADVERGERITLRVGENATLNFQVEPAEPVPDVSNRPVEEIVVTAVQTEGFQGGEVGTSVTPEQIQRLPQINRNFLSFADLAPGVQFIRNRNGSTTLRGGAQHQRSVNVFLDGVSQKDYVLKGGVTGQDTSRGNPFPQSAIAEYRVITQNYKAEYDQVSSAAITAVTASGTNEFKSNVFWDYTDEGLREATPLEEDAGEKVASSQSQYGADLSGPIIEDKLHFIVAFEAKDNEDPVDIIPGGGYSADTLPAEYAPLVGREVSEFKEDLYFGKLDWIVSDNQEVAVSLKHREESAIQGFQDVQTRSYGNSVDLEDTRFQLKHTYRGEGWQNEFRITWEDSRWNPNPLTDGTGQVLQNAAGQTILQVGAGRNLQRKGQEGWGVRNDFTLLDIEWLGRHTVKAGVKHKRIELSTLQQLPANPQYFYNVELNGPGTFELVQPYKVEVGVPLTEASGALKTTNNQYGVYLQDDWEVNQRLTLNLGVRWDYEETPSYANRVTPPAVVAALESWPNINNPNAGFDIENWISTGDNRDYDGDNIAPRLGFSLLLDPEGTHELYGGYGRSYDRNQFDFLQLEVTQGTFGSIAIPFQGDPANPCGEGCIPWDPAYLTPEGLGQLLAATTVEGGQQEINLLSNDLETPYSDQYSLGIRSTWGAAWSTDLTYSHVESRNGFNWLLGNRLPDGSFFEPGTISGPPFGFTPPGFASLLVSGNDLRTETDAVFLKVERFHQDTWGVSFAYTYSDARENRNFDGHYALDYPTIEGYGVHDSVGVPAHRLVVTGTYDLPWGVLLAGKLTLDSGAPLQYLDCLAGDDQCVFRRLDPDESEFRQFDLSVSKSFALASDAELRVRLDVINVFNTRNWVAFDTFPGNVEGANENFGEPTGPVADTRTAKVSVNFAW